MNNYRLVVELPDIGAKVESIFQVSDVELEGMDEEVSEEYIRELARPMIWDHVSWKFEKVNQD